MKRALKIIIPLLLSVAILVSIGWFFLKYDPDLTRDLLLQQARRAEENDNLNVAVWFYDLAYSLSQHSDQVAIELAEQFKAIGNYTKAEYTLSSAIQDGGTVELYIALSQTYVEQDKLLDAVQMLNKISNPELRQELDALRPEAPKASLESGQYSQYLPVALTSTSGTLYFSTDGEYPSMKEDLYQEPILLPSGDSTVYAVSVADNGLVSPLSVFNYAVENVIEPVDFQDAAMEDAVRKLLHLSSDHVIYTNELWDITEFTVPAGAVTFADLVWMPRLETLIVQDNVIDSLEYIQKMSRLHTLTIEDSVVSAKDLLHIAQLPSLRALTLSGCSLSTIENLRNATGLTYLNLNDNTIRDISVLTGMTGLKELHMNHNALVSLTDIAGLTELEALDVAYNSVVSTAPLSSLTALKRLDISGNGLMQLEGMEPLTNLIEFSAAYNKLLDVNVIAGCKDLEKLDISNNTLLNIDIIAELVKLRELNFSHNEISSLPAFQVGCPMVVINGSHNQLSSLDYLGNLTSLQYVLMDYNSGINSIAPLAGCYDLILVNVYQTAVTEVHLLTDRGVTVNYKPV